MCERARQNVFASELKKVNDLGRMKSFMAGIHPRTVMSGIEARSRYLPGSFIEFLASSGNSETDPFADSGVPANLSL